MVALGLSEAGHYLALEMRREAAEKAAKRKALPAAGFQSIHSKPVPKPVQKPIDKDTLPLNVKYSVAIEENGRLKAEVERLKKLNAAQATELDLLRAKFLAKQVTLDG